jgi:protein-S-isoprenylcysteine O-methyltransferase Ste14
MSKLMNSEFGLVVVIISIITLAATGNLFSASPYVIVIQLAAVGLALWARRCFTRGTFRVKAEPGCESIIKSGPYRLIRHPMYAAVLLLVWSAVVSRLSPLTAVIGIIILLVIVARIVSEEQVLRSQWPEYAEYARTTKALIPYIV